MALRHPVPKLDWSLFGDGEGVVVPHLRPPKLVEFARGCGGAEFCKNVEAYSSVQVDAACGAGKTVDMPVLLLSQFSLVIHVMASRNLAGLQALYVGHKYSDKPVAFVDMDGELPKTGLVFMSAAQYMKHQLVWRKTGEVVKHVVYLDECHESDWATTVMRELRHNMPGCQRFLMASATHGTGTGNSEFQKPILPAKLDVVKYAEVDPTVWDFFVPNKPWSLDALDSDLLVFIDDQAKAQGLAERYQEAGVLVHRFTAATPLDTVVRVLRSMEAAPSGSDRITVLILDYSYRFGYTFPTVGRIIDTAQVAFLEFTPDQKATVTRYRRAYHGELVQTAARGGRVAGRNCVYYRPDYVPSFTAMDTEGVEVDAAVLLFRMMGFTPPQKYKGTPYFQGGPPAHAPRVLAGDTAVRCYRDERTVWPGREPVATEAIPSPKRYADSEASFEMVSPVPYGDDEEEQAPRRPVSGQVSYDSSDFVAAVEQLSVEDKRAVSEFRRSGISLMVLGQYYYLPGLAIQRVSRYDGFSDVMRIWGGDEEKWMALKSAQDVVVKDVEAAALNEFNESSAVVTAAKFVVMHVQSVVAKERDLDPRVLRRWALDVQGLHDKAAASGTCAGRMVGFLRPEGATQVERHEKREKYYVDSFLQMLFTAVSRGQVIPADHSDYQRAVDARHDRFLDGSGQRGHYLHGVTPGSGRYTMELGGVRGRVAQWLLKGDPVASVYVARDEARMLDEGWDKKSKRLAARFGPESGG